MNWFNRLYFWSIDRTEELKCWLGYHDWRHLQTEVAHHRTCVKCFKHEKEIKHEFHTWIHNDAYPYKAAPTIRLRDNADED